MRWPTFAPITVSFNKEKLRDEIVSSQILTKGFVATSHLKDGKNFWDDNVHFQSPEFNKQKNIPLWRDESHQQLNDYTINTFKQVNLTTNSANSLETVWEGRHDNKDKIPLWIKYDYPWHYRTDVNLPYFKQIVDSLGLEYFTMIRIVYQTPPSIGLIHKDSGPNTNLNYYESGGIGITLNVSSGNGNLYFVDKQDQEQTLQEEVFDCWHFDDSVLHCTNEVSDLRLQIRIYGKHKEYQKLMDFSKAIY